MGKKKTARQPPKTGKKIAVFIGPCRYILGFFDRISASVSEKRFEQGGYEAAEALLSRERLPRAIICGYDYMAIGAIRCILDKGLRVSEDILILGMDDITEAAFLNPPLASITTEKDEICRLAAEAVVNRINGDFSDRSKSFPAEFKHRRSFML